MLNTKNEMNDVEQLQILRSKLNYLNDQLTDTYDEYVEDVEKDTLEEFNQLNQFILEKIGEARTALNLLALNGFTWTQGHTNSILQRLNYLLDLGRDLTDIPVLNNVTVPIMGRSTAHNRDNYIFAWFHIKKRSIIGALPIIGTVTLLYYIPLVNWYGCIDSKRNL